MYSLEELGFNSETNQMISLLQLSEALQTQLEHSIDLIGTPLPMSDKNGQNETHRLKSVAKVAVHANRMEVTAIRTSLENVKQEKEKLKHDLTETNDRVAILAQDLDEQNARLEESHKKKMR